MTGPAEDGEVLDDSITEHKLAPLNPKMFRPFMVWALALIFTPRLLPPLIEGMFKFIIPMVFPPYSGQIKELLLAFELPLTLALLSSNIMFVTAAAFVVVTAGAALTL